MKARSSGEGHNGSACDRLPVGDRTCHHRRHPAGRRSRPSTASAEGRRADGHKLVEDGRIHTSDRGDVLPVEVGDRGAHPARGRAGRLRGERSGRCTRSSKLLGSAPDELRPEHPQALAGVRPLAGIMASSSARASRRRARGAPPRRRQGAHPWVEAHAAIWPSSPRDEESPHVVHAIEAHHYEVQPQTVEAILVSRRDLGLARAAGGRASRTTSSGSRPSRGSRRKKGVERYALRQAGDPRHGEPRT